MKITANVDGDLIKVNMTNPPSTIKLQQFWLTEAEAGRLVTELQRALVDLCGEAPF